MTAHRHHPAHAHPARAHRNTMPRGQARLLLALALLLVCSGGLWMLVHWLHWPAAAQAAMAGMPSPWESGLMRLHGGTMMLMLIMAGRVSATHAQRGWRLRQRRRGGLWMVFSLATLALTGYALFYWVPDEQRDLVGLVHGGLGLLWALSLLWHRRKLTS